ncbi:basic amino acid/polyamine antiporter [Luteimicrobium subarcticum]|uniref:basic amino acid/polyamine antiporter n=1 Tax=Luteimicrobium subarcticum TaxID=620910 RepID=UPI002481A9E6|nr:basic amino acid/polyamine antiporter [Luteimicrobium subarcticum]
MTGDVGRADAGTSRAASAPRETSVGRGTLVTLVVGSMVGAGVFSLPGRFADVTGVAGTLITWALAGTGMFLLALVLQSLAVRAPHLDAGIYAYAKAGFGEYAGFLSAIGYWASACVGNVAYWVLIMSTVGQLWPALGAGDTWLATALSSAGIWGFFLVVRRGIRSAAGLNRVVTVAKVVPLVAFVLIAVLVCDPHVLADNWSGSPASGSLVSQVRGTLLVTVFAFLGVEGASVWSRHARDRRDVGRATVLGFLSVLAVFASVTVVSYGVLPQDQIAALPEPSLAGVLEAAVGTWGSVLVSVGLVVAVLGAYLSWTLMAAEVLFVAARDDDMPRFLRRTNAADVPVGALLLSAVLAQAVLLLSRFSQDAFTFAQDLTSALALVPYVLAAGFGLLVVARRTGYGPTERAGPDRLVAGLATLYTLLLLVGAGPKYVLVSALVYAPATVLLLRTRREQGRRLLRAPEVVVVVVLVAAAASAVVLLATDRLDV